MKETLTVVDLKAQIKTAEDRIASFVRTELDLFYSETGMQVGSIDVQLINVSGFDGKPKGAIVGEVELGVIL